MKQHYNQVELLIDQFKRYTHAMWSHYYYVRSDYNNGGFKWHLKGSRRGIIWVEIYSLKEDYELQLKYDVDSELIILSLYCRYILRVTRWKSYGKLGRAMLRQDVKIYVRGNSVDSSFCLDTNIYIWAPKHLATMPWLPHYLLIYL